MFAIADEAGKYQLMVGGYSGDAGDAMAAQATNHNANWRMFSTPDSDNDAWYGGSCSGILGGWWFGWCTKSILNSDIHGYWVINDVAASRMLVKID